MIVGGCGCGCGRKDRNKNDDSMNAGRLCSEYLTFSDNIN
jgi:hypothetical protein